jgi:hypothetical protein
MVDCCFGYYDHRVDTNIEVRNMIKSIIGAVPHWVWATLFSVGGAWLLLSLAGLAFSSHGSAMAPPNGMKESWEK